MDKARGRLRRRLPQRRAGPPDAPGPFAAGESDRSTAYPDVIITGPAAPDPPSRPARRALRLIAPAAAAALVAATAVVVTVLGHRGPHAGAAPPPGPLPAPAPRVTPRPALAIDVTRSGCDIFVVKNLSDYVVLHADSTPAPRGTTLLFNEVPLVVRISSPACADVYIHGHRQRGGPAGSPWTFAVSR